MTPLPPKHKFSETSKKRLDTCHTDLQRVFYEVVKQFDCSILDGHRGKERQNAYFRARKSKKQWPNSKHNTYPSLAVDVAPYPIDWDDLERFRYFAGYVMGIAHSMGIRLLWGGDWDGDTDLKDQTFNDLCHFELIT